MSYNNYSNNNNRFGRGRGGRGRGGGGRGGGRGGGSSGGHEICKFFVQDRCNRPAEQCRNPHVLKKIGEAGGHEGSMKDIVMWEAHQQVFTCASDFTIKVSAEMFEAGSLLPSIIVAVELCQLE